MNATSIIGLDLAGVETRPTGYCKFLDMKVKTSVIYTDAEILSKIRQIVPRIVAVDAPLSLPPGTETGLVKKQEEQEKIGLGISTELLFFIT